jgi:hypothetical protein
MCILSLVLFSHQKKKAVAKLSNVVVQCQLWQTFFVRKDAGPFSILCWTMLPLSVVKTFGCSFIELYLTTVTSGKRLVGSQGSSSYKNKQ